MSRTRCAETQIAEVCLAVGGYWPGLPDASTPLTPEMLVDYVRVYRTTPAH